MDGQEGMDPVHLLVGAAAALLVFFILLGVRHIALSEAGFQPWILRGGMHWLMPLQYRVHRMPLVTITSGSSACGGDGQSVTDRDRSLDWPGE